ncbi:MAG TPA: paraquat-inducible protein A [Thiobacillaceae bacterium]|nr:paraquat-inducible protein A [Thiobacillaceae bacterium]
MDALTACPICGLLQRIPGLAPGAIAECVRCGSELRERKVNSIERTLAFTLAALILYLPANIFPILRMVWYGAYSENTVWQGCVRLWEDREWLVAGVVFLASIVIPLFKLIGLLFLVASKRFGPGHWQQQRLRIYRLLDVIGPWAMLDVFLLSILVALVKLGQLVTILPGPGLLAFTAVVVLTILATASFDPRLIWDETR